MDQVKDTHSKFSDSMEGFRRIDDELQKVIEKEESSGSVSDQDDKPKPHHREAIRLILSTPKFQIGVIVLVVIDLITVIAELMIDMHVMEVHEDSIAPHILHYISIGILAVFVLEVMVKVYVLRKDFFHHYLEVFDAIVVLVSFALDVAFAADEGLITAVGLLIVLRLWRVARIINGIVISVKTQADRRLHRERQTREAVEQELAKFREYCAAQEAEIESLQALLRKNGIEFAHLEHPVAPITKIEVVAEVNECKTEII